MQDLTLFISLVFIALACILMGAGVPTTAHSKLLLDHVATADAFACAVDGEDAKVPVLP